MHWGSKSHIAVEMQTVGAMIRIYCKGQKHSRPCNACDSLQAYAFQRLERCFFGELKPACKHCPVHCYKPGMRDKIREVMRYAGPRMLWRYPVLSVRHKLSQWRNGRNPAALETK